MSTEAERQANDAATEEMYRFSAKGDEHAERYLWQIDCVARTIDDLVDKDHEVREEKIYEMFFILIAELWRNPFFIAHAHTLLAHHLMICNAWRDANRMERSDNKTERAYAHVMKDMINELVPMVAFLTGGYSHMVKVSERLRQIALEDF